MSENQTRSPGESAMSKTGVAYSVLRERIETGALPQGERILPGAVAAELGMSIVPVREAIRRLEAEHLVTIEHNVGARVAAIDDDAYRYGMEALAVIDAAATALAAPEITAADLAAAREINARIVDLLVDFDSARYSILNMAFHETLSRRCPNPRLRQLAIDEWARFGGAGDPDRIVDEARARETVREHSRLLDLITAGEPAAAIEQAARAHVLSTSAASRRHTEPPHI